MLDVSQFDIGEWHQLQVYSRYITPAVPAGLGLGWEVIRHLEYISMMSCTSVPIFTVNIIIFIR